MALIDAAERGSVTLERAARLLTRRTAGALALVALVVLGLAAIEVRQTQQQDGDARAVNVAGRQRTLSQRMAGSAVLAADGDAGAAGRLAVARDLFDDSHAALVAGDGTFGVVRPLTGPLVDVYLGPDGVDDQVRSAIAAADTVLAGSSAVAARAAADALATAAADPLLAVLDDAASLEEAAAQAKVETARRLTILLAIGALVVLWAVERWLLRPVAVRLGTAAEALRRLEDERARRGMWQREFAAIASHELRTPVTVVTGITSMLGEGWEDFPEQQRRELLDTLERHGHGLRDLLEELNVVAGLGGPSDRSRSWSLDELALPYVGAEDVSVDVPDDCWVDLDRRRTELVVRELVENARRHGCPPVEVRLLRTGGNRSLELHVADRGPGMATRDVERLLLPFGRGTAVDNHSSLDGRGLGLAMVRAVVEETGGGLEWVAGAVGGHWRVVLPNAVVAAPAADRAVGAATTSSTQDASSEPSAAPASDQGLSRRR
jgi:signal transduction histidine kinase